LQAARASGQRSCGGQIGLIESGKRLAKQLEFLAEALGASVVLGAWVPIALTSRADRSLRRMASCALALLLVRQHRFVPSNKGRTVSSGSALQQQPASG
jgi:hypothetical protein